MVDVSECHACHAKRSYYMSPRARPAKQRKHGCHQAPPLPRKTQLEVANCRSGHANHRWRLPIAAPAKQNARGSPGDQRAPSAPPEQTAQEAPRLDVPKRHAFHANATSMSPSTTPATQRCAGDLPEPAQCHKRHACHAKRRVMCQSDTPGTQSDRNRRKEGRKEGRREGEKEVRRPTSNKHQIEFKPALNKLET